MKGDKNFTSGSLLLASSSILAAATLAQREIVQFFRQRSRVVGAILPPILFWFLIGSGLSGSFQHQASLTSLQYFFPGTIVMIVLFTAIFSTISIIEDRKEGFLQSVLVAPIPRSSIALGKISGGALIAFFQGMIFLLLAPALGASLSPVRILYGAVILLIVSFGLTGLGFLIAWGMESTQGFHAVMNLFLMPMWFLSGALFPVETAPRWLKALMMADPLTYSVTALQKAFYISDPAALSKFPSPEFSLLATLAFSTLMFAASVFVCARRERP